MALARLSKFLRQTVLRLGGADVASDGQLLEGFVGRQDQEAFGELVRRHGPMVMQVCQRKLGHVQDAEDAFQAVFVVLARRAATVARMDSIGGWLHGVAYRTALCASKVRYRRGQEMEMEGVAEAANAVHSAAADVERRETLAMLDEELQALPEKHRLPLVLFYLEGRPIEQLAQQLRCRPDAAKKRLERGRERLRDRLGRRGMPVSGAALLVMLSASVGRAMVPAALAREAVLAARVTGGGLSASVQALANGALQSMGQGQPRSAVAALLLLAGLASVGLWWMFAPPGGPAKPSASFASLNGHQGAVTSLAFAPDGTLASASFDGTARIWSVADRRALTVLRQRGPGLGGLVVFSKNGEFLAWVNPEEAGVQVVNVKTGNSQLLKNWIQGTKCGQFADDGREFAAVTWSGNMYRWDTTSGRLNSQKRLVHDDVVHCAALSPNNRVIALGYLGRAMLHYETTGVAEALPVEPEVIGSLSFCPSGRLIAAVGLETLTLYDVERRRIAVRWPIPATARALDGYCPLTFSPDGRRVVCGRGDRLVVWDVVRQSYQGEIDNGAPVRSLAIAPDNRAVAVGAKDGTIRVWDLNACK